MLNLYHGMGVVSLLMHDESDGQEDDVENNVY
jgi:hypothetical protein